MCLSLAIHRPDDVLATGEHLGFEWQVIHNRHGYRCGYVRVPPGHPWHGKNCDDDVISDIDVHGGITFAEADEPCEKGGPDNAWWVGFDTAHYRDLPDLELLNKESDLYKVTAYTLSGMLDGPSSLGESVRTQDYVEHECRRLCDQAAAVQTPTPS